MGADQGTTEPSETSWVPGQVQERRRRTGIATHTTSQGPWLRLYPGNADLLAEVLEQSGVADVVVSDGRGPAIRVPMPLLALLRGSLQLTATWQDRVIVATLEADGTTLVCGASDRQRQALIRGWLQRWAEAHDLPAGVEQIPKAAIVALDEPLPGGLWRSPRIETGTRLTTVQWSVRAEEDLVNEPASTWIASTSAGWRAGWSW